MYCCVYSNKTLQFRPKKAEIWGEKSIVILCCFNNWASTHRIDFWLVAFNEESPWENFLKVFSRWRHWWRHQIRQSRGHITTIFRPSLSCLCLHCNRLTKVHFSFTRQVSLMSTIFSQLWRHNQRFNENRDFYSLRQVYAKFSIITTPYLRLAFKNNLSCILDVYWAKTD